MTISILTPARRRPNNVLRMIYSVQETMSGKNRIEMIFRIDEADETLNNLDFLKQAYSLDNEMLDIIFIIGKETFPDLGVLWNECWEKSSGDILQMGGDDLVYSSKNWDEAVVRKSLMYPDQIYVIWGKDHQHDQLLSTHAFVSRKWCETLGWLVPPTGITYFNDNFIHGIGAAVGRLHYISDMVIMHVWRGNRPGDPNYDRMATKFQESSDYFYGPLGREIIHNAVGKLTKVMGG